MANNTELNSGSGGDIIATEDISGVKHELVKIEFGANGTATKVSADDPMPVTDADVEALLTSLDGKDFSTQTTAAAILAKLTSDPATQTTLAAILAKITSDPATQTTLAAILAKLIAAPATEAKQDTGNTSLASIDTKLTNPLPVSGTITINALPAGSNNIGDVDVLSIAAGDNNIGNVDVVTLPSLPAGANAIGKLAANDGIDIGDVTINNTSLPTSEIAPTTVLNGKKLVTTAGTRVTLASSTTCKSVTIKALRSNTGLIYVGDSAVSSSNGLELSAGESVNLDIANLQTVNIDSTVNGEGVTYLGVN